MADDKLSQLLYSLAPYAVNNLGMENSLMGMAWAKKNFGADKYFPDAYKTLAHDLEPYLKEEVPLPEMVSTAGPYSAPKLYGAEVTSNKEAKADRLDLPSDPNQTAHPRVQMSAAQASPASKSKSAKPKKKPTSPAESIASWIMSSSE